jgi:GWxTD domain-containing protein|tara:strand:- start:4159 stop:5463 length:1305 start_codon:yes stop_codon:yes gene_type:complete
MALFQTDNTSYLETYLSVNGKGVKYKTNENGNYQAQLSVSIEFIQDDKVIKVDKYNLSSPEIKDTSSIDFLFLDQQRYQLTDGNYTLKLNIKDVNSSNEEINHEQPIEIKTLKNGFSDVQLVESYSKTIEKNMLSKGGYDLVPFISNLYNTANKKISCYFEYYSESNEETLIQISVISQSTQKIVNNLVKSKKSNSTFYPSLNSFSIEELPTGTYSLKIEAKNRNNEIIHSQERLFYKLNKDITEEISIEETFITAINDKDTLKQFIEYLKPLQSSLENIQAKNLDYENVTMLQNYFYRFWNKRDPFNTEQSWLNYYYLVKLVNKEFRNGIVDGYLSDRGRIYLSYGSPNSRSQEIMPKGFQPFEVWHYYNIGSERDVKFIFSNDRMPNEYRLVYTNKFGEINDKDWLNRFEENYYDDFDEGKKSPIDYYTNPN